VYEYNPHNVQREDSFQIPAEEEQSRNLRMPNWRYLLGICAEGLRKTMKYFSRHLLNKNQVFLLGHFA